MNERFGVTHMNNIFRLTHHLNSDPRRLIRTGGMEAAPPPSRRTTRPPPQLRTKTGCLTCRHRRKKCDETKPDCLACQRNWLECRWPLTFREVTDVSESLKFPCRPPMQHTAENPDIGNSETLVSKQQLTFGEVNRFAHSEEPYIEITREKVVEAFLRTSSSPQTFYSPSALPNARDKSGILHFIAEIGPYIVRQHSYPTFFDYSYIIHLAVNNPIMMHAFIALSYIHKSARNIYYYAAAVERYGLAIKTIRHVLDSQCLNGTEDWLILFMDFLCLFERWNSHATMNPAVHLTALINILRVRYATRGVSIFLTRNPVFERTMVESTLYQTAFLSLFNGLERSIVGDYSDYLQEIFAYDPVPDIPRWSNSPILGLSPSLFLVILKILEIRPFVPLVGADRRKAIALHDELMCLELEFSKPGANCADETVAKKMEACRDASQLFFWGAKILILKLIYPTIQPQTSLIQDQVTQARGILALQPTSLRYDQYLTWPLVILGLSSIHNHDKTLIRNIMQRAWDNTGCGDVKRSLAFLDRVWSDPADERAGNSRLGSEIFNTLDILVYKDGIFRFYGI